MLPLRGLHETYTHMDTKGKKIILGSGSPRRRELLSGLDICFEVDTRNSFEEEYDAGTSREKIPQVLSEGKSMGFHRELSGDEILLTSDTLVLCGDRVMGKPHSREEAVDMLKCLSGCSHKVITAVTIRNNEKMKTVSDTAIVHFKQLTDSEIEYYVDNYRPFDKAGAYGIQEAAGAFVEKIDGDFYNVVGLPLCRLCQILKDQFNIDIL